MIKSSFYSFETAKRAIMNSQLGLDVIGNNVSNVNTGGYTRQRLDQAAFGVSGYSSKYSLYGRSLPGQGSVALGISQIRDPFLDNRYRAEYANIGDMSVKVDILTELESILDEITKDGSDFLFGDLIEALTIFNANATEQSLAALVRDASKHVAMALNKTASQLEDALTRQFKEFQGTVDSINGLLKQISDINRVIREEHMYGNPALDLIDQRNLLIDDLSQYIDISVEYRVPEGGTVQECYIYVKGVLDGDKEQIPLVSSTSYNQFAYEPNGTDASGNSAIQKLLNGESISLQVVDGISLLELKGSCDLTDQMHKGMLSGQLSGFLNGINGAGIYANAGEYNDYRGIQYYRQALNDFTITFATMMNDLNRPDFEGRITYLVDHISYLNGQIAAGSDPTVIAELEAERAEYVNRLAEYGQVGDGSLMWDPDNPPAGFDFDNLFLLDSTSAWHQVNVGGIADATGIADMAADLDANYYGDLFVYGYDSSGNPIDPSHPDFNPYMAARELQLSKEWLYQETFLVVNRGFGVDGGGESNLGDNLNRFADAIKNGPGGVWGGSFANAGFSGTYDEFLTGMFTDLGMDLSVTKTLVGASIKTWEGIMDQRDGVSAVDANEEAMNMMIFQNYYNAAARYMTALDEALGTVIQGMGVVGR